MTSTARDRQTESADTVSKQFIFRVSRECAVVKIELSTRTRTMLVNVLGDSSKDGAK